MNCWTCAQQRSAGLYCISVVYWINCLSTPTGCYRCPVHFRSVLTWQCCSWILLYVDICYTDYMCCSISNVRRLCMSMLLSFSLLTLRNPRIAEKLEYRLCQMFNKNPWFQGQNRCTKIYFGRFKNSTPVLTKNLSFVLKVVVLIKKLGCGLHLGSNMKIGVRCTLPHKVRMLTYND